MINNRYYHYLVLMSVYTRENGAVPFETVPFGTEQSNASCVNAKRFQMVPAVITMEEECVLNHKVQFSSVLGA